VSALPDDRTFAPRWARPLASRSDLLAVALSAGIGLLAADSVARAQWSPELPSLYLVAPIAAVTAVALARSRLPVWWAFPLAVVVGAILIAGLAMTMPSLSEHPLPVDRVAALGDRLHQWIADAFAGRISVDTLPFGLVVATALWLAILIGGFVAWRWRQPWLLIVLPGVILAVNVSYLDRSFDWHFTLFAVLTAVLVADGHRRRVLARSDGASLPVGLQRFSLALVALVSVGGVAGAHVLPRLDREAEWVGTLDVVSRSLDRFQDDVTRLFGGVTPPTVPDGLPLGPTLPLVGADGQEDRLLARVQVIGADSTVYLRASAYDTFDGRGWILSETSAQSLSETPEDPELLAPASSATIEVRVEVLAETRTLLTPAQPISVDIPATAIVAEPTLLRLDLDAPLPDGLPHDLGAALQQARALARTTAGLPDDANALFPNRFAAGFRLESPQAQPIIFIRDTTVPPDVVQLVAAQTLRSGDTYIVRAAGVVPAEQLRSAGIDYPLAITQRYLALPSRTTSNALLDTLLLDLIPPTATPAEFASAIEDYLCCSRLPDGRLRYPDEATSLAPPIGSDAAQWFLLERRDALGRPLGGSPQLHATAMTTILRAAGIPSRLAVGFVLNDGALTDDGAAASSVSLWRHDIFAWAEAYFPGYGWIPFNPTPGPDVPLYDGQLGQSLGAPFAIEEFFVAPLPLPARLSPTSMPPRSVAVRSASSSLSVSDFVLPGVALAALAAVALVTTAGWRLTLRGSNPTERTWSSLHRWARLGGLPARPSMTPTEFAASLGAHLGDPIAAAALADDYNAVRFGPGTNLPRLQRRACHADLRRLLLRRRWQTVGGRRLEPLVGAGLSLAARLRLPRLATAPDAPKRSPEPVQHRSR